MSVIIIRYYDVGLLAAQSAPSRHGRPTSCFFIWLPQEHLHIIETWLQKWKMKVNENKSSHITFAPVYINQTVIPSVEAVKYLGLHFDRRVTLKEHIDMKRKHLDHKTREIKWLIGNNSPLSLENSSIKRYSNLYGLTELSYGAAPPNPIQQFCRDTNLNYSVP